MRGIVGHGPMHWRGDRTGANRVNNETLEEAAKREVNEEIKDYKLVDLKILDLDTVSFLSIRKGIETYRKLFNNSE